MISNLPVSEPTLPIFFRAISVFVMKLRNGAPRDKHAIVDFKPVSSTSELLDLILHPIV